MLALLFNLFKSVPESISRCLLLFPLVTLLLFNFLSLSPINLVRFRDSLGCFLANTSVLCSILFSPPFEADKAGAEESRILVNCLVWIEVLDDFRDQGHCFWVRKFRLDLQTCQNQDFPQVLCALVHILPRQDIVAVNLLLEFISHFLLELALDTISDLLKLLWGHGQLFFQGLDRSVELGLVICTVE